MTKYKKDEFTEKQASVVKTVRQARRTVGPESVICALEAWAGGDETASSAIDEAAKLCMSGVGQCVQSEWSFIPGEGVDDLLGSPGGSWIRGDVEVEHPASFVGKDEEHEEHLVPHGGHDEEVDSHDVLDMVCQEGFPRGGGWLPPSDHVLLNSRLVQVDSDLALSRDANQTRA